MCKNSAHLASHIAGAEDNRVDESNNGAVDDESYDFSIISMHLNSIGFSLTTIFFIIIAVAILRYSSKVCLRKCFYIACPCCVSGLNREREHRKSRQNSAPVIPETRFFYPPPGTQALSIPRSQSNQEMEFQETPFSTLPPTGTLTRPHSTLNQVLKEKPSPARRQSNET